MKISAISGFVAGVTGSFFAVSFDSIAVFFASVILGGFFSGYDEKMIHRLIGLVFLYVGSFLGFLVHTILFESNALFGVMVLIFYSVFVVPVYLILGLLGRRIIKRKGRVFVTTKRECSSNTKPVLDSFFYYEEKDTEDHPQSTRNA